MKILITGGTGFIGSHLCEKLLKLNHYIICLDNNFTGSLDNIQHLRDNKNFEFIRHDIIDPIKLEVDQIYHLACPASPKDYQYNSIKTIKTNFLGTLNMLGLAKRTKARILLSSTSEIYGNPNISPQPEEYWGNVNPIGERSCYDEGKRIAETLMIEYNRNCNVDIRIARIFNTYGPKLNKNDGRVVSNFINQALENKDITIYGDGSQTRSFCYIDDQVNGLINLMNSNYKLPVNIGNPQEITILTLSSKIIELTKSNSKLIFEDLPQDDPTNRKPDITKAKNILNWEPKVDLKEGLEKTIEYFKNIKEY
ncbi:GDP-mannose 4,6 dehydratase [seawater metagenome]|uniref:UDP-glucuronate decarboxylase n=1 Tax=seawater metagenome TaxID=1561972 RepID=A0A5E8CLK9_9ZZZZ